MGTIADKLQAVLDSKNAIKDALTEITGEDVGNVMSTYADTIRNIEVVGHGYLSIVVNTDQETHDDVLGAEITVQYGDSTDVFVWEGESIQIKISDGIDYIITSNAVQYYDTPTQITGTIKADSVNTEIITYIQSYKITTIRFDQTVSDPATMITRTVDRGAIEAIRLNSHRYNGKIVGNVMQLTQLPDDGSGTPSTTVGTDVWMKLPQFYYLVEEIATDKWDISFFYTNNPSDTWIEWDGKDLIGVYEAYNSSSKVYSVSGVTPTISVSPVNFKSYAAARGTGFSTVKWKHHCMIAMLFYAWYSNTNCQAICGSGTSDYPKTTGATNSLGMTDTTTDNGNSMSINFWGLENWWGDIYETIDNISVNGSTWTITEDDGSTRTVTTPTSSGYINKIALNEYLDIVPRTNEGSSTTGFCDHHNYSSSSGLVVYRSGLAASAFGGVAYVDAHRSASDAYTNVGSRLAYRGEYEIVS